MEDSSSQAIVRPSDGELLGAMKDLDFTDYVIKSVSESNDVDENGFPSYNISTTDSTGFSLSGKYGVVPKAGDRVKMWTVQWSIIRGIQINNHLCFYRSAADQMAEQQSSVQREEKARQKDWLNDVGGKRSKYEHTLSLLPSVFKDRVKKFQVTNPDFDWQHGSYELMCCVDAVKVGNWIKEQNPLNDEAAQKLAESIADNSKLWKVIGLSSDHSGNSFSFAVRLGYWYARDPRMVVLEHGALTPLTGCPDYGCPHPYEYEPVASDTTTEA